MIRRNIFTPPPEKVQELLRRSASANQGEAIAAQYEIAQALDEPLRKGILAGNILGDIFAQFNLPFGAAPEFTLDPLAPGVEREHIAYAVPSYGEMPQRVLSGDYIMVPIYEVGNSISWNLRMLRAARYDVHARAMEIYEAGFVKKDNNDGFACLLTAAANRNIVVYDADAGVGRLTLKLLSLMQRAMRRNAGGNTASLTRGRLTDIYMSIEAIEDMRSWTLADTTETTREQIANSADGFLTRIYGINLHDLIEFGVGQEYQNLYLDASGINGALAANDVEMLLGLDLQDNSTFVNPIRTPLETQPDETLHRHRMGGVYGFKEHGFVTLDNRKILLGSL